MQKIVDQIIKVFEDNNLSVAQAKGILSMVSTELDVNNIIKQKKTT